MARKNFCRVDTAWCAAAKLGNLKEPKTGCAIEIFCRPGGRAAKTAAAGKASAAANASF